MRQVSDHATRRVGSLGDGDRDGRPRPKRPADPGRDQGMATYVLLPATVGAGTSLRRRPVPFSRTRQGCVTNVVSCVKDFPGSSVKERFSWQSEPTSKTSTTWLEHAFRNVIEAGWSS